MFHSKEEYYCPICGKRYSSIIIGKHKCSPEDLKVEEARLRAYDRPQAPPIGQQLEDGFDMLSDWYYEEND